MGSKSKQPAARLGDIASNHGPWPPTPIIAGAGTVTINGIPAARQGDAVLLHAIPNNPPHARSIAEGSGSVLIEGKPAARVSDAISCGGKVATGSGDVSIGDSPKLLKPTAVNIPDLNIPDILFAKQTGSLAKAKTVTPTQTTALQADDAVIYTPSPAAPTDTVETTDTLSANKQSAVDYWSQQKDSADSFPEYLAAHLMGLNAETGYSIAEGLQSTYEIVTDKDKFLATMGAVKDSFVDTVTDPIGTYNSIKQAAVAFSELPLSEQGEAAYKGMLGLLAGGGGLGKGTRLLGGKNNKQNNDSANPGHVVKSFDEAETRLADSRTKLKERAAAGLPIYQSKYTDQELMALVESGSVANERFLVSIQPKNLDADATLAYQRESGLVPIWTTSLDQIDAADTDPKLIHQVLGAESNYDPNKEYVMHIIDRGENLENFGNNSIVPTWDNLTDASVRELGAAYDEDIISKTLTSKYQQEYAKTVGDFSKLGGNPFDPDDIDSFAKKMSDEDKKLFTTRHKIRTEIGANSEFTGNGLTANTAPGGGEFGVVETLSIERNLPNLAALRSDKIIKTLDLKSL